MEIIFRLLVPAGFSLAACMVAAAAGLSDLGLWATIGGIAGATISSQIPKEVFLGPAEHTAGGRIKRESP